MKPKRFSSILLVALLAMMLSMLAACVPAEPTPQTGVQPTQPAGGESPAVVIPGLEPEDILVQLDFEPGFTLRELQFPFGRMPHFTLLADGRVIYVDELQDSKAMIAQLSAEEAVALLDQVREMGFERLQSHTDMCGRLADGSEPCIADASTSVMRVRMEDGSLREIKNYANFSNEPQTYDAIFNLLNEFSHANASVYMPHAATLFVRMAPPPEMSSPADWPLDPALVERAESAGGESVAVVLSAEEAALWQNVVGVDNMPITFQLEGQPVSALFVPWLPGQDFTAEIEAEFPTP